MIAHFDDFCLWVYVVVDDVFEEAEKHVRRSGLAPVCCFTAGKTQCSLSATQL